MCLSTHSARTLLENKKKLAQSTPPAPLLNGTGGMLWGQQDLTRHHGSRQPVLPVLGTGCPETTSSSHAHV